MYRRHIIPYFDKALIPIPNAKRLPKRNGRTYVVEIFKRGTKKGEKDDTAIVGKKDCKGGIMKTYGKKIKIKYKSRSKIIRSASPDMEYLAKVYRIYRNRDVIEKNFRHADRTNSMPASTKRWRVNVNLKM